MIRTFFPLLAAVVLVASPAASQKNEGRRLAELSFESADTKGKGYLDQGDMEQVRKSIFVSMDGNADNKLQLSEFMNWDYGFQGAAAEKKRERAYQTSLKVVYAFWDRNGDGAVTNTEHRKAIMADFTRADLNNDAVLQKDEFVNGFSVLVAIRAALKD